MSNAIEKIISNLSLEEKTEICAVADYWSLYSDKNWEQVNYRFPSVLTDCTNRKGDNCR